MTHNPDPNRLREHFTDGGTDSWAKKCMATSDKEYVRFPLPARMDSPLHYVNGVTTDLADRVIKETLARFDPVIKRMSSYVDPIGMPALARQLQKNASSPESFFRIYTKNIAEAYLNARTGSHETSDEYNYQETKVKLSGMMTHLSELIGPKLSIQFYKTLTDEIDSILHRDYGLGQER